MHRNCALGLCALIVAASRGVVVERGSDYLVIDSFLSEDEVARLISLSETAHFSRSGVARGGGATRALSAERVAETAWLSRGAWKDRAHAAMSARLLDALGALAASAGAPPVRSERCLDELQLTRYEPGGKYEWHRDAPVTRPAHCARATSPRRPECRVYTAIVYLDDVPPDAGGATTLVLASDARNVSVQPKRGRALLFLASTAHAGEPLLRGRKRIVNQWVYEAEQSALAHFVEAPVTGLIDRLLPFSIEELFVRLARAAERVVGRSGSQTVAYAVTNGGFLALLLLLQRALSRRRPAVPAPTTASDARQSAGSAGADDAAASGTTPAGAAGGMPAARSRPAKKKGRPS